MTLNQFTIGTKDVAASLVEFLKNVEPGSRIKLTLDNGVSQIAGELIVDETGDDRLAARVKLEGGQDLGGIESDSDDAAPAPKSGAGSSVMAALGLDGKDKVKDKTA